MTLPAFIRNFTDRLGANLGTRAQPYLSIEGDRLTLIDANGDTEPVMTRIEKGQAKGEEQIGDPCLDCIIVDGGDHHSQIYYGRPYDPKGETFSPPMCWSDNGVAPSVNCSEPQAVSCTPDPTGQHGCKWAVWGSGRAAPGSKTVPPACSKYQKLALMIPGDDIQFLLRVPPNSLVQLGSYNAKFKGQTFSMVDVVTRISIRDKTLHFTGIRNVNDAEKAQRDEIWAAKKTDALVGRGDKPRLANPAPIVSIPASAPVEQPSPLFAGNAAGTSTLPPPAAAPAAQSSAPTRRRGKPPKEAAPPTNGSEAPTAAPFPHHGMAQAPEPNADLEASLKTVFG